MHSIVRGQSGCELSAMIYGNYFPNPAIVGMNANALACVSQGQAMLAEALGTAFLGLLRLRDDARARGREAREDPLRVMIGLTVSIIICRRRAVDEAG